ncbi:MAG: SAM-dependent methyltransferase [Clostridia bacterium]|nr:SAM-dependent methyltransferase [Clostridia bacterium]
MYSKRIRTLCSLLSRAESFADIGCDHGYCSEYMLENDLCSRVTVTDISAECLKKAQTLLRKYVDNGKCTPLCTDGLKGVDKNTDLVLIAGMGGMEIVQILTAAEGFIPKNFVLQPMRDGEKVRKLLLDRGACIRRDFTFFDGKFYDVITGSRDGGTPAYTQAELDFGRENIQNRSEEFLRFLQEEIKKRQAVLTRPLGEYSREQSQAKLNYLQGVFSGEIK